MCQLLFSKCFDQVQASEPINTAVEHVNNSYLPLHFQVLRAPKRTQISSFLPARRRPQIASASCFSFNAIPPKVMCKHLYYFPYQYDQKATMDTYYTLQYYSYISSLLFLRRFSTAYTTSAASRNAFALHSIRHCEL